MRRIQQQTHIAAFHTYALPMVEVMHIGAVIRFSLSHSISFSQHAQIIACVWLHDGNVRGAGHVFGKSDCQFKCAPYTHQVEMLTSDDFIVECPEGRRAWMLIFAHFTDAITTANDRLRS